jgi:hypothetical protein
MIARTVRNRWHGFHGFRQWRLDGVRSGFEFEPRDVWVGIYWNWPGPVRFDLYICLLPMLPLHLSWKWIGR